MNLRVTPDTNAKILTSIPKYTEISIYLTDTNGWYYTYYGGKEGYIKSDYITFSPPQKETVLPVDLYNVYGAINCHGLEVAGFNTDYVINDGQISLNKKAIDDDSYVTAVRSCYSKGVT